MYLSLFRRVGVSGSGIVQGAGGPGVGGGGVSCYFEGFYAYFLLFNRGYISSVGCKNRAIGLQVSSPAHRSLMRKG